MSDLQQLGMIPASSGSQKQSQKSRWTIVSRVRAFEYTKLLKNVVIYQPH